MAGLYEEISDIIEKKEETRDEKIIKLLEEIKKNTEEIAKALSVINSEKKI